jgi:hypothetical protein
VKSFASLFVALAAAAFSALATAHSVPGVGQPSLMLSKDKDTGTQGYGFDHNVAVLIFNLGVSVRHWEKDVTAWNGRRLHNEGTFYAGLGLLNLIQLQSGWSNAGRHTRIRSDIVLGEPADKCCNLQKGIGLTAFIEKQAGRRVYGFGIGMPFQ